MRLEEQNILFFTRTMMPGGTENVILQLCEIFGPLVNKIVVCSCGGVNVNKLKAMGIRHFEIPDIESKSLYTVIKTAGALKKIVRDEKITVIHTHHRMAAFYVSLLGLYKKHVFINTSHNTFSNKKKLTQIAYKRAYIVACGEKVKNNLTEFFEIPERQVTVIHNAVKPFEGPETADDLIQKLRAEGDFIIGNIGRLSQQKGMEYYVKSIPIILKHFPKTRFFIIGSGEEEEKLKTMAEEEGICEALCFTGYRSDIQNIIAQLDLVVLSSLWEGFPLTPMEAFSMGRTIVATAVDGTVEIVENEKTGLLVEPKSPEQIAEKVIWMMKHPKEKKKMELNALKKYQEEFSMKKFAETYISYYERI